VVDQVDELASLYRLTDALYRARSSSDVYDAALDAILDTLGCGRASILLFDEAGVMRFVAWRGLSNEYVKAVEGHSPWKLGQRDPQPIFVEDIDKSDESEAIKAVIRGEGIRALAFIPLVAQGVVVGKFMTYYRTLHVFDDHEIDLAVTIARQVGFSIERARADQARQRAEEELRTSKERFRLMSEDAPVMIWICDPQGKCLHLNSMLRTFWGVAEEQIPSFDWRDTMHPDDGARITEQMVRAVIDQREVNVKGRYRDTNGRYRVLETNARPHFSANGEFLGLIGVNVDVTAREDAEAQRDLLLAELNHRVKNTLAVVQSIAHQTFKGRDASMDARRAFEGRLVALATAHNLLTQANWRGASLERVAGDVLQVRDANRDRVTLMGPDVSLQPKEALAIAMALHELCTNATKYGALSNEAGRVSVEWGWMDEPHGLRLTWRERGGPPVTPPTRRGFGSRLVERTVQQDLDGDIGMDFREDGLICSMEAHLPRLAGEL
jgi:PAS domain S-box-containing protein